MALSGQYTLNRTFENIRDEVLQTLQIIGDGQSVTTAMSDRVKVSTNNLLKQRGS